MLLLALYFVHTYFMHREYSWHRATATLTTQEGNVRSRVWLARSKIRDSSCLACGESSAHLQHTHAEMQRGRHIQNIKCIR